MPDPRERRYRRLLWCYPRAYRRARGDELVATLLEAGPGRPSPRLRANLIRHGLRCRLGRPASRSIVVWAALATVICGLFAAAAATRVAWETARLPPDPVEAAAILHDALPDRELSDPYVDGGRFVVYTQPVTLASVDGLLFGDGGEYQQGRTFAGVTGPAIDLAAVQNRWRDKGWRVYEPVHHDAYSCGGPPCDPTTIPTDSMLVASRGDVVATLTVNPPLSSPGVSLELTRATPLAVYPAGLAGGLLGGGLAWLVFGWASRRTEARRSAGGLAVGLLAITLLFWWPPVLLATASLVVHQLTEPHPSWHPLWEWLGQPLFSLFFLVGVVSALLALIVAALWPRRASEESPQWTAN